MATLTDYLIKRGHTWFVQVQIPAHLRKAAGGRFSFVKTLKTRDLSEANKRKHHYIAVYRQRIAALERQTTGSEPPAAAAEIYKRGLVWRENMESAKGQVIHQHRDGPEYLTDFYLEQISDEARVIDEEHGETVATAFYKTAKGEGVLLLPQVEPWLAEQTTTRQTKAQHRTVLREFNRWAKRELWVEDVTRRYAGEYVGHLLGPDGLKPKTVQRYLSSLSSLWAWLEARGLANDNPWLRQGVGKKSKRGETQPHRQWTDEALVKILSSTYTARYTLILHDLVRLALVTGARLDELCALKVADVRKAADGWWLKITEGKTAAAVRTIPVHDSVAHVLERRMASSGDFLFDSLVPGGPDGKRSWNASKAFGHFTRSLDLKAEERQTFHSLRKSFVEVMEAAEVPPSTIQLIIGHTRQSLALTVYSQGQRVELRNHAANVMPVIREIRSGATTLREIADALNARGIPTARGGLWHASTVTARGCPVPIGKSPVISRAWAASAIRH
jgi:integrase